MPDTHPDFCCAATAQQRLCKEEERCWARCLIGPTRTTAHNSNRATSCCSQLTASRKPRTPNSNSSATSAFWKLLAHATEARSKFNAPSCSRSRPSVVGISAMTQPYLFYESLERRGTYAPREHRKFRGIEPLAFTPARMQYGRSYPTLRRACRSL